MKKLPLYLIIALAEIFLLLSISFSISYFMRSISDKDDVGNLQTAPFKVLDSRASKKLVPDANSAFQGGVGTSFFDINIAESGALILQFIGRLLFSERGIVSALQQSDIQQGTYSCILSKDGKRCQEYPASECADKCDPSYPCIPSRRDDSAACRVGTCYNSLLGVCSEGTPQGICQSPGVWFSEPEENIPECRRGCCLIGGQSSFITQGECRYQSQLLGITTTFKPGIQNEYLCALEARGQLEGACVFQRDNERDCRRMGAAECGRAGGFFHDGWLCSHPSLNTTCKPQQTTGCATGNDGSSKVYWFDSCGNRENVYDYVNRVKIQQEGFLIPDSQTCAVRQGNDPLASAKFCGNCNVLDSSICSKIDDKSKVASGDYACKSMECIDKQGNKRSHLESWCYYDSAIGLDAARNRASDAPGSRHFLSVCKNGVVETNSCGEFREQICVETKTQQGSDTFSTAACRPNLAKMCILANYLSDNERSNCLNEGECQQKRQTLMRQKCLALPDCFVKQVSIDTEFSFEMCAPKYPTGFILTEGGRGEGAESVCALGSQKCQYIKIKGIFSDEIHNKNCITPEFTEKMNDLCMSLGDCGGKVNFEGVYSGSYKSTLDPPHSSVYVRPSYINQLLSSIRPTPGKVAEPAEQYFKTIGGPSIEGMNSVFGQTQTAGTLLGIGGIVLLMAAKSGVVAGTTIASPLLGISAVSTASALSAAGGAVTGAAIGLALTSFLLDKMGVSRGLPAEITYSLIAAGAAGGALVGYGLMSGAAGSATPGIAAAASVGIILIVVVIIVIVIFKLLGIGKIQTIEARFTCEPWQPPLGGNECSKCDGNNPPCSPYSCRSLGQTCELINEGTSEVACINVGANDSTPPVLKPLQEVLTAGYNYANVSERGYELRSSQGCLQPYTRLTFGIAANEPSKCRIANNHTESFDAMPDEDFGISSLFRYNHSASLLIPDLPSLGYRSFDPNLTAASTLYVRCTDKPGNKNVPEYAINFCVKQGPDLTQPFIQWREPQGEFTKADVTNQLIALYVNEPATCKWDMLNVPYDSLRNEMTCANNIADETQFGWRCSSLFPVNTTRTLYYVKCKDQPWLQGVNESIRNPSPTAWTFTLQQSKPLEINVILPDAQKLEFGSIPVSTEIVVKTTGGSDDGRAQCFYKWDNNPIMFRHTFSVASRNTFSLWQTGIFTLPIQCKDSVGNIAEKTLSFDITLDNTPPLVTRVYSSGNNLQIVTNEPATCTYSTTVPPRGESGCYFAFENGSAMIDADTVHTAPFSPGLSYYVKCRDRFSWDPGDACSIVIRRAHET